MARRPRAGHVRLTAGEKKDRARRVVLSCEVGTTMMKMDGRARSFRHKTTARAVVLALVWLGVQGCGDDDDGGSDASGAGTGNTASGGRSSDAGAGGADTGNAGAGDAPGAEAGSSSGGGGAGDGGGGTDGGAVGASGSGGDAGSGGGGPVSFLPLYENGERLRAVSLGEKGSSTRRWMTWYDTELETECTIGRAEDGEYRCLPRVQSLAPGFRDAACEQPIYYDSLVRPCTDTPSYRAEEVDVGGCGGKRIVRMKRLEIDEVYHKACSETPVTLPRGASVWEDAEPVPPERFVKMTGRSRVNDRGFGVYEWIGEDGSRQVTSMFDAEYGACSARELADAGVRCLPRYAVVDSPWWFADECEDEQLAYGGKVSACVEPVQFALHITPGGQVLPSVSKVGEPVSGTVHERRSSGGECTPHDSDEVLWTLYPVEEPFDAKGFFPLTEQPEGTGRVRTLHDAIDDTSLTLVRSRVFNEPVFFDAESEAPCLAFRYENGWLCLPEGTRRIESYLYRYADADCSEVVVDLASADPVPDHVVIVERNHCVREDFADEILGVYAVGEPYSGSVYQRVDAGCVEAGGDPEEAFYRLESVAPPFPFLVEETE